MSGRMRYGPRFQPTVVNTSYTYDESIDRQWSKDMRRMGHALANQPLHKKELRYHKISTVRQERARRRDNGNTAAREEIELRTADAIRKAVEMLEFAITELNEHPNPRHNYRRSINQIGLVNAVVDLKTRCGVKFDERSVVRKVSINDEERNALPPSEETEAAEAAYRELNAEINRKARERQELKMKRFEMMRKAKASMRSKT